MRKEYWRDTHGPDKPVAVVAYKDREEMEDDMNVVALTPGNRWTCDTVLYEGSYGYTCIYTWVPQT